LPDHSEVTFRYLNRLWAGFASPEGLVRTAAALAFELHAKPMTEALASSLVRIFHLRPLNARIVEQRLFHGLLDESGAARQEHFVYAYSHELLPEFLTMFDYYYKMSLDWCATVAGVTY
jgi:hypothetical protein